MESNERSGRYVTLRDYLRVLRRYRWAILALAVIGAAAGYGYAKQQQTVYQSGATVSFQDPGAELALVGYGSNSQENAADVAEQNALTLTRPQILRATQRKLGLKVPLGEIAAGLSAQTTGVGLLQIDGSSTDPLLAQRLANAAASAVVAQSNAQAQAIFVSAVAHIKQQMSTLARQDARSPLLADQLAVYEDELARLTPLTKTNSTAQIVQPATAPGGPVSPKPTSDALIGAAIGLVLALLIAFVRDSFDRRLRTAKDIEECLHLPVVGHVRREIMGRIPYLANGGGDHSLDIEAARILRRNLEFLSLDHPPRSVLVTSGVPQEGKTTVAASLAFAMAAAGRRTLLVECDLRRPVLASRLQFEPNPGLSDYLAREAAPEEILREIPLGAESTANGNGAHGKATKPAGQDGLLMCIPAGTPTSAAAELLGSERFQQFLSQVTAAYDVVVIDSTPLLPVADALEILPQVDAVIVCTREHETKREEALAAKAALARFPERPTGVVITGLRPDRDDSGIYSYSYSYS
jgi:Mrp family chromosome partitioning ATPase/capsular polysaccharide biosynthesis protein